MNSRAFGPALFFAILVAVPVAAQQGRPVGTVADGVYTNAQAARGQVLYAERCASCHGAALGGAQGPPLVGEGFLQAWGGPLADVVDKIRSTMPVNDPGKLTVQQSADVTAYLLQVGKYPAGRTELPADAEALKVITLPRPAPSAVARAGGAAITFPAVGNLAQVMRGILFPSSNLIFNVQGRDPAAPRPAAPSSQVAGGSFPWADWGAGIYSGWEMVDYAAIALAESAPLMLTPGRRCENGRPVPVSDPDWIRFTQELAEAGKAAYKASQTRKQDLVSDVTDQVATSCSHCHEVFRDKRGPRTPGDPSNKVARCVR